MRHPQSLAAFILALAWLAVACHEPVEPRGDNAAAIRLSADVSGTAVSTLVVTVTASDITTPLVFNIPVVNQVAQGTIRIPPGAARTIDVQAFDPQGNVLFEGSKTIDVQAGQNPPLQIPLVSRAGQVTITATLGPVSLMVTPGSASLAVAGTVQLAVTITAADGEVVPGPAAWATTDPALATVDQTGLVTAVRSGAVDIVATFAGVAAVSHVTVLSSTAPTVWTLDPTAPASRGFGYVWASAPNDIHVVDFAASVVQHWDGTRWSAIPLPVAANLPVGATLPIHIWGVSPSSVYLAASISTTGGGLFHYNGSVWQQVAATPGTALYGVWGATDASVSAVGAGMAIYTLTPSSFAAVRAPTSGFLRSVWGAPDGTEYAVGSGGTILTWDGSSWSQVLSGTQILNDVWGTSATNVYATGTSGALLHFNGSTWSQVQALTSASLAGISGTGPDNIVVVGSGGTILHFDGTNWSAMASGTTADLVGVWALGPTDFIVTGSGGTMLRSH